MVIMSVGSDWYDDDDLTVICKEATVTDSECMSRVIIIIIIIFVHRQTTWLQVGGAPTVRSDRVGQYVALRGL